MAERRICKSSEDDIDEIMGKYIDNKDDIKALRTSLDKIRTD